GIRYFHVTGVQTCALPISNAGQVLGFYANDPGLNLRDSPSVNGKVLKKLKGDLFEITPTTQSKGLWVKVKVKKYKEHPCTSDLRSEERRVGIECRAQRYLY